MKRTLASLALMCGAVLAQGDLEAKLEKKLAKPFVANGGWETDYDKAREAAKASGKVIFAYFTRSYSP